MYINPDYYLYEKIKELQTKVIRLTDELADANYTIKKLQQKNDTNKNWTQKSHLHSRYRLSRVSWRSRVRL